MVDDLDSLLFSRAGRKWTFIHERRKLPLYLAMADGQRSSHAAVIAVKTARRGLCAHQRISRKPLTAL